MKSEGKWQVTGKRFVAYLDIMGFKDFVARYDHKTIYFLMKDISKIITAVNYPINSGLPVNPDVYTLNFSDSIFIFSKDDSPESFESFSASTSYLFGGCIERTIPLKGSIAFGTISVDKDQHVYFGQPIIDAYMLQDEVDYYGIVAHHSFEKYYRELKNKEMAESYYFNIKTPLKSGFVEHINLDWSFGFDHAVKIRERKTDILHQIDSLKILTSGGTRRYIDNTKEVYFKRLQSK